MWNVHATHQLHHQTQVQIYTNLLPMNENPADYQPHITSHQNKAGQTIRNIELDLHYITTPWFSIQPTSASPSILAPHTLKLRTQSDLSRTKPANRDPSKKSSNQSNNKTLALESKVSKILKNLRNLQIPHSHSLWMCALSEDFPSTSTLNNLTPRTVRKTQIQIRSNQQT